MERQLGERIRKLRLIRRRTLRQFASLVGVSLGYRCQSARQQLEISALQLRNSGRNLVVRRVWCGNV